MAASQQIRLSVYVITRGRPELLRRCCQSILVTLPKDCELVVVVNGSDPESEDWLRTVRDERLRWFRCPPVDRGTVRNRAWELCRAPLVHFLDDDLEVPAGIFDSVLRHFEEVPDLALLGGPNLTPPGSGPFEKLCGELLASPITCPLVWRRYKKSPIGGGVSAEYFMIGCNFAVRLDRIPTDVRFGRNLVSNEENIFYHECRKRNCEARVYPDVYVFHYRRANLTGFLRQIFSYGKGRGQQFLWFPKSNSPVFLLPLLGLALIPFAPLSSYLWYLGLLVFGSAGTSSYIRKSPLRWIQAGVLSMLVHFSYALGILSTFGLSVWEWGRSSVLGSELSPLYGNPSPGLPKE